MKPTVRLAKDPTTPPGLREAIDRAAAETAPRHTLDRVLGATGTGAIVGGAIANGLAHASRAAPRWAGASLAAKGASVLAIFAMGAAAGGYAVHRHDVVERAPSVAVVTTSAARVSEARVAPPTEAPSPVIEAPRREAPIAVPATPATPPSHASDPRPRSTAGPSRSAAIADPFTTATGTPDDSLPASSTYATESTSAAPPSARAALESLRAIRDAVDGRRPGDALAAIEAHRAQYPHSPFDQELLLLEAEARWQRHEPTVCSLLATFGTLYPRSLLRRRAESLATEARCLGGAASP